MKTGSLLLLTVALAGGAVAAVIDVNLPCKDVRLKDGTVLAEATVKSYNSTANTVVLLANKELTSQPAAGLPEEVITRLKALLPAQSGEEQAAARAREAENYDKAVKRAERRQQEAEEEARATRAATLKLNVKQAETAASKADATLEEVAKFAAAQARIYFNYQDDPLSNIGAVIGSDLVLDDPEPVPGWTGRYRVEGTAYRQFINNQASGYGRGAKDFEILIQTRDRKRPEVVDIRVK
ncbi:MAG TPA: hypothetical protein VG734_14565 [Lacunisphaera sp.]|nr:hypothetical protein [Lacunisphaera sp.]